MLDIRSELKSGSAKFQSFWNALSSLDVDAEVVSAPTCCPVEVPVVQCLCKVAQEQRVGRYAPVLVTCEVGNILLKANLGFHLSPVRTFCVGIPLQSDV